MKIHAIQTGTVRIHERQRSGVGHGLRRTVNALLDSAWTEPLPIYAWAIEHGEGVLLVDTGETARTAEPGYFPRWHPYFRMAVRAAVSPEDEIGARLLEIGIRPGDVRRVILTHLHTDHAGGLHHFPRSEIVVTRAEHAAAVGLRGRLRGYLPNRWPAWFASTLVDPVDEPFGPFPRSLPLTSGGDIRIVPTPGHTVGHASVVVDEGDHVVMLAGDASYTERDLLAGRVDGVSSLGAGEDAARESMDRIRALAAARPTVYLPTHDPASGARLAERRVIQEPLQETTV